MKNKIILILVTLAIMLWLSACNKMPATPPAESNSDPATTDTEKYNELPEKPEFDRAVYDDTIKKYKTALTENWDMDKYNKNDICYLIWFEASEDGGLGLGYAFLDMDSNGTEELLIGLRYEDTPLDIFEMYTVENGKVTKVFTSDQRAFYVLTQEKDKTYKLAYSYSDSAAKSGSTLFRFEDGKLIAEKAVWYDAITNEANPWFMSISEDGKLKDTPTDEEGAEKLTNEIEENRIRPNYTALLTK